MNTATPSEATPGPGQEEPGGEATVLRMLLGAQLHRLRRGRPVSPRRRPGMSSAASRSKVSRMETGRAGLGIRGIQDLLTLYAVAGEKERANIIALAGRPREPERRAQCAGTLPGWFRTYLSLEFAATAIRTFKTRFVPGPFQTEDYARAVTGLATRPPPPKRSSAGPGCACGAGSSSYLDQRQDAEHYIEVAGQLSGEALAPAESARFIQQVAHQT